MLSERLASLANNSVNNKPNLNDNMYSSEAVGKDAAIERDMEKALAEKEFKVYYQSRHDTATGKLIGAEALVRWEHSEYGLLTPTDFVPAFEKNGFITKLDEYVRTQVCKDMERWYKNGYTMIPVNVNLSRVDFNDANLADSITALAKAHGINPELLCFEITETAFADNQAMMIYTVNQLRYNGFKIALDDFGTGYSSFSMLNTVPLDAVKLDKSMLDSVRGNKQCFLLDTCIKIGKEFSLQSEAEGVETREQYDVLRDLDCDSVQGFYFSRPLPVDVFELRLANVNQ